MCWICSGGKIEDTIAMFFVAGDDFFVITPVFWAYFAHARFFVRICCFLINFSLFRASFVKLKINNR